MSDESTYAAAPFDHAKADIILRSSDNIDFRVFGLFLSLASPVFEALFDITQPTKLSGDQEVRDGLAVIPVSEDSKTLDMLLRFCYPCTLAEDPSLDVLKDAMDVLDAAMKYSLDVIEKRARQAISSPKILEAAPLQCFAIAHRGHLREETLLAAKHTLTQPLIPSWFQEIELISASALLSLLTYHSRCGDAVYALRLDLSWIKSHYGSSQACFWLSCQTQNCSHCRRNSQGCGKVAGTSKYVLFNTQPPKWWEDFMEETFTALQDRPCKSTVQACAEKTVQSVKAQNCQACPPRVTEGMRDFVDLFVRKIEETVSQVSRIARVHPPQIWTVLLTDRVGVEVLMA